ncbi:PT domain-containing protein [Myxococcota bacterium]|nr:PT domain-containing protein [Myxococcota bacterium]
MHNETRAFMRPNGFFWLSLVVMAAGLGFWGHLHWQSPPWHDQASLPLRLSAIGGHALCGALLIGFFVGLAPLSLRAAILEHPRLFAISRGYLLLWWCVAWAGMGLPLFGWAGILVWGVCALVYASHQNREASYAETLQAALPFGVLGGMMIQFAPAALAWLWWIAPWFGLILALCSLPLWRWTSDTRGALLGILLLLFGLGPWLAREQRYTNALSLAQSSDLQPATLRPFLRRLVQETAIPTSHTQKLFGLFVARPNTQHEALRCLLLHWTRRSTPSALPQPLLQQITWNARTERLLREQLLPHPSHQAALRQQALALLSSPQDAPLAAHLLSFFARHLPQHRPILSASISTLYFSSTHQDPLYIDLLRSLLQPIHGKDASIALLRFFFQHHPQQPDAQKQQWLRALLSLNAQDTALLRRTFSEPIRAQIRQHLRSLDTPQQILGMQLLAHLGHSDSEWLATFWDTLPPSFLDTKLRHPHPSLRAYAHALRFQQWASYPLRNQQLLQALRDPSPLVRHLALSAFPSIHQQLQHIAPLAPIDPRLHPLLFQTALQALRAQPQDIEPIAYTLSRLHLTTTQKQQAFSAAKTLLPLQQARSARFLRSLFALLATLEPQPTTRPTTQPITRPTTQPITRPTARPAPAR